MVGKKVVMGLSDRSMKAEVLRCIPRLESVNDIIRTCEVIESAEKAAGRSAVGNVASVLATQDPVMKSPSPSPDPTHIEVAASGASRRPNDQQSSRYTGARRGRKRCRGCGDSDCRGDRQCRAFGVVCRSCGLKGHFWRQCPTLTPKGSAVTSSAVTVGSVDTLASLPVIVVCGNLRARCSTMAVADTGAQVSMAGRTLLNNLGILQHQLQPAPVAVNHVAGGGVRLLGSLICQLVVGPVTTNERIFFANGVERLYLSLGACKSLCLVPPKFPCHSVSICSVAPLDIPQVPTRPEEPPYELVEENVDRLEKWFLEHFGRTVFAVGRAPLPEMQGPPHHIHLRPDARPHAVHVPATVPHHFYDEVRQQLDDDIKKGIIEAVPAGEPTEWCSRMVVVPKKDGRPRRTVDFQRLNRASMRETHHTRPPFDLITSVPKHTFKTVADAYSGYHQIPLDKESRKLTTFITPWGRFRYCRTPMGHCAAQDAFTKRLDDIISTVPRKMVC